MIKSHLPNWVGKYVRKPFAGGCWDLSAEILLQEFGITVNKGDVSGWSRTDSPREGDVIAIGFPQPSHIGVVCADGFFVHLLKKAGVVCTRYDGLYYKKRVYGFFRHESRQS